MFREKLREWFERGEVSTMPAVTLDRYRLRDEEEAHRKAWDTRGRKGDKIVFHGTTKDKLDSILKDGLKTSKAGSVWPEWSKRGHTYFTNNGYNAKEWATEAAKEALGHGPGEVDIAIIAIRIPASEKHRAVFDKNFFSNRGDPDIPDLDEVTSRELTNFQFDGDIPPEWIEGAAVTTFKSPVPYGERPINKKWSGYKLPRASTPLFDAVGLSTTGPQTVYMAVILDVRKEPISLRDEAEAHRKQWDTIGRKADDPKPVTMRAATDADKDKLKSWRVPPAWTNVQVNDDPDADLLATGTDVKGRKQYLYSAAHSERQAAAKFDRMKAFTEALPDIRRKIEGDIDESEEAAVLYLIDKTGFRIGGDDDTGADVQAYGATTLRSKHVTVNGDKVRFKFTGKKGVEIVKKVEDPQLARIIRERKERIGRGRGPLFDTTDGSVRRYLNEIAPGFQVKDFRTYQGTAQALRAIEKVKRIPKTEAAFKKARREVGKVVANYLGNTPAIALKSYIDPAVWSKWRAA